MKIVILAAGLGSRLAADLPKPLSLLADGRTILQRQLDILGAAFGLHNVMLVVGYRKELLIDAAPDVAFAFNPRFAATNTSQSLLRGLRVTGDDEVLWLNGDVVFDEAIGPSLQEAVSQGRSFVGVTLGPTAAEEVKFALDSEGRISLLSKQVTESPGEAIGINFVTSSDKPALVAGLTSCLPSDYFERGIELALPLGASFDPLDLTEYRCIEVDSEQDLDAARSRF